VSFNSCQFRFRVAELPRLDILGASNSCPKHTRRVFKGASHTGVFLCQFPKVGGKIQGCESFMMILLSPAIMFISTYSHFSAVIVKNDNVPGTVFRYRFGNAHLKVRSAVSCRLEIIGPCVMAPRYKGIPDFPAFLAAHKYPEPVPLTGF
jgi:hypothetical protein